MTHVFAMLLGVMLMILPDAARANMIDLLDTLTGKTVPGTLTIYLVDDTGSPPPGDKQLYAESVRRSTETVGPGDSVMVARISDTGLERFTVAYSANVPKTGRRFEDLRAVKEIRNGIVNSVSAILEGKGRPQTTRILDVFSALAPAINEARAAGLQTRLIVVSDMIEESAELDMRKQRLDLGTAARVLGRRKKLGLVPDLKAVKIYLIGGSGIDVQAAALGEKFWRTYLETGCGGQIVYYGRTIPRFF